MTREHLPTILQSITTHYIELMAACSVSFFISWDSMAPAVLTLPADHNIYSWYQPSVVVKYDWPVILLVSYRPMICFITNYVLNFDFGNIICKKWAQRMATRTSSAEAFFLYIKSHFIKTTKIMACQPGALDQGFSTWDCEPEFLNWGFSVWGFQLGFLDLGFSISFSQPPGFLI